MTRYFARIATVSWLLLLISCTQKPPTTERKPPRAVKNPEELSRITGLVVPPNLPALAARTHLLEAQIVSTVKSTTADSRVQSTISHPAFCDAAAEKVDLRTQGFVSPVKDQQTCGACWAFATNAVLESSYRALRQENIVASEQELISCSTAGTCSGGWWAFDFLMKPGIESDKTYSYEHADSECRAPLSVEFRALKSDYVKGSGQQNMVPSDTELKAALCSHGPLAVGFRATANFIGFGNSTHDESVFSENDTGPVNHGIALIGWENSKSAWIVKNSWGTDWGNNGFINIKFGTNSIGMGAAWAEAWPKDYVPGTKVRKVLKLSLSRTSKVNAPE